MTDRSFDAASFLPRPDDAAAEPAPFRACELALWGLGALVIVSAVGIGLVESPWMLASDLGILGCGGFALRALRACQEADTWDRWATSAKLRVPLILSAVRDLPTRHRVFAAGRAMGTALLASSLPAPPGALHGARSRGVRRIRWFAALCSEAPEGFRRGLKSAVRRA